MPQREHWKWSKAGVRRNQAEALKVAYQRYRARTAREANLAEAYRLWRLGGVQPWRITSALDLRELYGPEVDEACGVKEPCVDMWEAGQLYPTWEQLLALAELTRFPVHFFTMPGEPIPIEATSLLCGAAKAQLAAYKRERTEPVLEFLPTAVEAVTRNAPETLPEPAHPGPPSREGGPG